MQKNLIINKIAKTTDKPSDNNQNEKQILYPCISKHKSKIPADPNHKKYSHKQISNPSHPSPENKEKQKRKGRRW
jgi:hypothetical protein